jgi:NDP-sugar pyrophosphorylase family protein
LINLLAVILASGSGERFNPLTTYRPKPLLPAANQPILRYLIQSIVEAGFTKIIITLGYLAQQIEEFLSTLPNNIPITQVLATNWSKGPLASLNSVVPYLEEDEPFVLLPADLYISATSLQCIIKNNVSECAVLYDPHQSRKGPVIQLGKDNLVTKFYMSSILEPAAKSSLPVLYTTPKLFSMMQESKGRHATTVFELLTLWIETGHQLHAIPIKEETWFDVDIPSDLINLNRYLLTTTWPPSPTPIGEYIPQNTPIVEPLTSDTLTIGEQTQVIGPTLLDPYVQIGNRCTIGPYTCLGNHTIIQDNTVLSNCITLPHTKVPPNAELENTILDPQGNAIHGTLLSSNTEDNPRER